MMKTIKVVAAVICRGDSVFATQRGYGNYKDWWEFPGGKIEAGETPEARFAHAMDNFQPLMLNNSNGGSDWKEHVVTEAQVRARHKKTQLGSEKIFEVTNQILENCLKNGLIHQPPEKP